MTWTKNGRVFIENDEEGELTTRRLSAQSVPVHNVSQFIHLTKCEK